MVVFENGGISMSKGYRLSKPIDGTTRNPGPVDRAILKLYEVTNEIRLEWPVAIFCCCKFCVNEEAVLDFTIHSRKYKCPSWIAGHLMGGCPSFHSNGDPISSEHVKTRATDHADEAIWLMPIVLEEWVRSMLSPAQTEYGFDGCGTLSRIYVPTQPRLKMTQQQIDAVIHLFDILTPFLEKNPKHLVDFLQFEMVFNPNTSNIIKRYLKISPDFTEEIIYEVDSSEQANNHYDIVESYFPEQIKEARVALASTTYQTR